MVAALAGKFLYSMPQMNLDLAQFSPVVAILAMLVGGGILVLLLSTRSYLILLTFEFAMGFAIQKSFSTHRIKRNLHALSSLFP